MSKVRTAHWVRPIVLAALGMAILAWPGAIRAAEQPKAAAKGDAPKADKTKWKSLFDGKSLKGWKTPQFGGEGKVEVKDGAIVLEQGNMMTGVAYAGNDFPKMDFEVTLEGRKVEGNDFFATTTFPVADSFCSLVVGGWGGTVLGLSSIDYMDASENQTGKFKEFKQNQWYKIRIRVTKERIQAWIDEEQLVDVDTKDRKISIRFECDPCKPFGIASYGTTGAVRDIRVRLLTEAEKKAAAAKKSEE
jgi:3-keto-disaccharide hydrolase